MFSGKRIIVPLILFSLGFSACRTSRNIAKVNVQPLETSAILENVARNGFNYDYFTIKRINFQYKDKKTNVGFIANLKAEKSKKILISFTKLSVPVGRVLLILDSVKYVNYIDQNYYKGNYSFVRRFLNFDLDFETIEAIISGNPVSIISKIQNKSVTEFQSLIESGMYMVTNENSDKDKSIIEKMYFDPVSFSLTKLQIEDLANGQNSDILFDDFQKINEKNYPGNIIMDLSTSGNKISLYIRNSGFSTDPIESFNFSIPQNYQKLN